jgi:hypothetical protein
VGSIRVDGVRFAAYPNDHAPPHVHGEYGTGTIIVDIFRDRTVGLSLRKRAIVPSNMKAADVKKVLLAAERHVDELWNLWEEARGRQTKNDRRRDRSRSRARGK